jgi:uncharacterized repeat protein (TIGR01451 family)
MPATYTITDNDGDTDTATLTLNVADNKTIDAVDDSGSTVNGVLGGESLSNVLTNDELNGTTPVDIADVNLTQESTTHAGVTLNLIDGSVNVAPGTPKGNYTLTYKICEKGISTNCDTATVSVPVGDSTGADLSFSKTVDNPKASGGDYVVLTLTVKNHGPDDAAGIKVSDQIPAGYDYVISSLSQGSYDDASGEWDVGSIAVDGEATLNVTVKVLATGEHKNVAEVTASGQNDPDSTPNNHDEDEDDQASVTIGSTNVFDPPSAWKVVDASGWPTIVWEQVWINNGNLDANPVRVVDPIPDHYLTPIQTSIQSSPATLQSFPYHLPPELIPQ